MPIVSYLGRNPVLRAAPVQDKLGITLQANQWSATLRELRHELPPAESMEHGGIIDAMCRGLDRGEMPPPGVPLAISMRGGAAVDHLVRRELAHLDVMARPYLRPLIEMGPDVRRRDGGGDTLLNVWARSPAAPFEAARHLCLLGARIDERDGNGATALMWRTAHGQPQVVNGLLTELNADPALRDNEQRSARDIAAMLSARWPEKPEFSAICQIFAARDEATPTKSRQSAGGMLLARPVSPA